MGTRVKEKRFIDRMVGVIAVLAPWGLPTACSWLPYTGGWGKGTGCESFSVVSGSDVAVGSHSLQIKCYETIVTNYVLYPMLLSLPCVTSQ